MKVSVCTLSDTTIELKPPKDGFGFDKTADGWILEEEGPPSSSDIVTLRLSTFLAEAEDYVNGEEMLRRSIESVPTLGPLAGQHQAEMLLEQQDNIPVALRNKYLVFAGTVWRAYGARRVPCLCWHDAAAQFALDFVRLDYNYWRVGNPVVRLP